MPYVAVDNDRKWVAEEQLPTCPQLIQILSTDTPYLEMDFSHVLAPDTIISSVAVTERDGQSITVADESVSATGKSVSFKVSSMTTLRYHMKVTPTLSTGTSQTISKVGTLLVG